MIAALALFRGLPLRIWAALAVLLLALAGVVAARQAGRREGAATILLSIGRANDAVQQRADRAGDVVDRCVARGGRWLRELGACEPAVRGDR